YRQRTGLCGLGVYLLEEVHIGLADYARFAHGLVKTGRSCEGLRGLHIGPLGDDDHVARIVGVTKHACPQRTALLAKSFVSVVYGSPSVVVLYVVANK